MDKIYPALYHIDTETGEANGIVNHFCCDACLELWQKNIPCVKVDPGAHYKAGFDGEAELSEDEICTWCRDSLEMYYSNWDSVTPERIAGQLSYFEQNFGSTECWIELRWVTNDRLLACFSDREPYIRTINGIPSQTCIPRLYKLEKRWVQDATFDPSARKMAE